MSTPRLAAVALIALTWAGCGPSGQVVHDRTLRADDVLRRVRERDEKILTLHGGGSITFESPEESGSGSFTAEVRKPDSARVELTGPFGIRLGTLALSRDNFVYYDWRANTATIGTPDDRSLRSIFNIPLRFEEILRAFTGEFLAYASNDSLEKFGVEEESYVFRYRSGEITREFRIDGDTFVVTSYRYLAADGSASLVALASRQDEVDDIWVPKLLRVIMPKDRKSLTVSYSSLRINGGVRCSFAIPREAKIIRR